MRKPRPTNFKIWSLGKHQNKNIVIIEAKLRLRERLPTKKTILKMPLILKHSHCLDIVDTLGFSSIIFSRKSTTKNMTLFIFNGQCHGNRIMALFLQRDSEK